MPKHSIFSYITWSTGAFLLGLGVVASPFFVADYFNFPTSLLFENLAADEIPSKELSGDRIIIGNTALMADATRTYDTRILQPPSFSMPNTGVAVSADLAEMMLRIYTNGIITAEYPIKSKGKPGSLWETPTGSYSIQTKEENHYSTIGGVWMPYSMQFFGNFFIHGWPEYANGAPVPEGYSGGCIRLSTQHAAKVFESLQIDTPVFVTNGASPALAAQHNAGVGQLGYRGAEIFTQPPSISGRAALMGDLENGYVFFEKNSSDVRSIASLSKMMTALVSLEAVNQFQSIVVTPEDIEVYGEAGGLRAGDAMETGELLWPLLLASSNDASYTIARAVGISRFVELMNEKAKGLGLLDTFFKEPSGLDPENRSTAIDVFQFTRHIWENKRSLLDMTKERSYKFWRNIHPFVAKESFEGGKTGYIPEAEKTILSVFSVPFGEFAQRPVAIIVLGSYDIRSDVERLRVWVKNNFRYGLTTDPADHIIQYAAVPAHNSQKTLSLLFTGDIMMDRGVETMITKYGNSDWSYPFQHIASDLQSADITFGNLEGPISDVGANVGSIYSFRMDPRTTPALLEAGFDVVSLANNHMGDWGRPALEDTMRRLRREGIVYAGAGWNQTEALRHAVVEAKGTRVGFLAFTDVGPDWLEAGEALSGIAIANKQTVEKATRLAKDKVDILVVSFHFGEEYAENPSERQKMLSRAAIDAGARVVIGHHPHVVQRIEEYKGGIIAYSLGNFVFDQTQSKETMEGMMLRLEFANNTMQAAVPIPFEINDRFQPITN